MFLLRVSFGGGFIAIASPNLVEQGNVRTLMMTTYRALRYETDIYLK